METTIIIKLASAIEAFKNCQKSGNVEWAEKWQAQIDTIAENLPSGSGFDSGTKILLDECAPDKVVLQADFHHMDENGYYDGWTVHKLVVTPSFNGFSIRITGRDKRQIKEYISDTFYEILSRPFKNS